MKKGEFPFPLYFPCFFPFIFSLSAGDVDADDASYRLKCIICNFTALDYHFLMTAAFASLLGVLGDGSHSVSFFFLVSAGFPYVHFPRPFGRTSEGPHYRTDVYIRNETAKKPKRKLAFRFTQLPQNC